MRAGEAGVEDTNRGLVKLGSSRKLLAEAKARKISRACTKAAAQHATCTKGSPNARGTPKTPIGHRSLQCFAKTTRAQKLLHGPRIGQKSLRRRAAGSKPKRKCNRVCLIAGCFVALVLLSLVELLVLPLRSFGADDARINISFDGRDIIVDARAHPTPAKSYLHEARVSSAKCDVYTSFDGEAAVKTATLDADGDWPVAARENEPATNCN